MSVMQDILVDIPDEDLPLLASLYENHVKWAPHVLSLIHTGIKWKKSEKYRNCITFMSPNNSWQVDGTIIVLMEFHCYDIFMFALDEKLDNLYRGLMETNRIDFKKRTLFFAIHEKHIPTLFKFANDRNLDVKADIPCTMYTMPAKEAKLFSIECPPDVYIKKLDPSHAVQVNAVWPHRYPNSEKYLAILIEMNGGYGVFKKSNDELMAWVMKHCLGHLGMLQSEEAYKKKGYGSLVTKALSKEIGEDGDWPFGSVLLNNLPSHNLFRKLGFRDIGSCTFSIVEEKS